MSDTPDRILADVPPHQVATFKIAMAMLGGLALAQLGAVGWSLISRVEFRPLGHPIPQAPAMASAGAGEGGVPAAGLTELEQQIVFEEAQRFHENRPTSGPWAALSTDGAPLELPDYDPTEVYDPAVARMLNQGIAARADGDTQTALGLFRAAQDQLPGHPRILYELASTYEAMALVDRAVALWTEIRDMGSSAGELSEIAKAKLLGGGDDDAFVATEPPLSLGAVKAIPSPPSSDGERVTLQVPFVARPGTPVDQTRLETHVYFFDLINGERVDLATADPPSYAWVTGPAIDWAGVGEEIFEVVYFQPKMTPAQESALGRHQYYGYVVKAYYDNVLIDQAASPPTLFGELLRLQETTPESPIDTTLFPGPPPR